MQLFHLHIEAVDADRGLYSVYPDQAKNLAVPVTFDQQSPAFKGKLDRLHERRKGLRHATFGAQEVDCRYLGKELFKAFLQTPVPVLQQFTAYRAQLPQNGRIRLALHLDPSLYRLPWELLHDPDPNVPQGSYLSLKGSVVRYVESGKQNDNLINPSEMTLLFVLSSPEPSDAGQDEEKLPALPRFKPADRPRTKFRVVDPASFNEFKARLLDKRAKSATGLVFFGHGEAEQNSQEGYLLFLEERVVNYSWRSVSDPKPAHAIGDAVGDNKNMELALVFACESAWSWKDFRFKFEDTVVGALLDRGWLSIVVGAQDYFDFYAAREFFGELITAIEDGRSFDLAVSEARQRVTEMRPLASLDWWLPVLYARVQNFELLPKPDNLPELPATPTAQPAQKASFGLPTFATALRAAPTKLFAHLFASDNDAVRDIVRH